MLDNSTHLLSFLCYGFLYLAVISLWVPIRIKFPLWTLFLGLSFLFGLMGNYLDIYGLISLTVLSFFLYFGSPSTFSFSPLLSNICALLLCLGLSLHIVPGFHNFNILRNVFITSDAIPFSLYLNLDKTAAGILILGLTCPLIKKLQEWKQLIKITFLPAIILIGILIILSLAMGYVRFDPKLSDILWIWVPTNLLFVCMAEEALFRGFIQQKLNFYLSRIKGASYYSIFIAALLFGLMHYTGGIFYVLLATIAGVGYGWVYYKTARIEASIITHFSLNLIHILFFTYPALK